MRIKSDALMSEARDSVKDETAAALLGWRFSLFSKNKNTL